MNIENVIWVSSYPKSGNTWVHQVLKLAATSYDFPVDANMDAHKLTENGRVDIFPKVKVSKKNCTVLKTHDICTNSGDAHLSLCLSPVGSIYVRRNPLDVLLSYINFSKIPYASNRNNVQFKRQLFSELLGIGNGIDYDSWKNVTLEGISSSTLDYALDYFSDHGMTIPTLNSYGSWLEHNIAWQESTIERKIVILYEDCIRDKSAFYALNEFFDFTNEEIDKAVEIRNERTIKARDTDSGTTVNNIFYNKMASYYYINYFSKAAISRFLNKYGSRLEGFGYSKMPI